MPYITIEKENSADIQLYYKDWGSGQPVVFSHGWPLTADAWEDQMVFLAAHGYRCVAHDRRGHGRSSQPWNGNNMDTYADDLAVLVDTLDLRRAIHVGPDVPDQVAGHTRRKAEDDEKNVENDAGRQARHHDGYSLRRERQQTSYREKQGAWGA